jgi:glycosyltransferase involved in cell wall biosynthesis
VYRRVTTSPGPAGVLHVCDKFGVRGSSIHGVTRLFSWWFPRYDAARFRVSLCGLKKPEPASALLAAQGVPVEHLNRGAFDPRLLFDLVRLIRRRNARILHVHGYAAADFGRLAARLTGAALVLHEHFADPRMPRYQAVADFALKRMLDRAIAVSHSTREFLVRDRFVPAERVRLIWNGAPLDEFAPAAPDAARRMRRELGLRENGLVVGAIGRLSEQKGHRFLIDAAARALTRTPFQLLIVGDGDLMDSLKQRAEQAGIGDRCVFAGHRTDVPAVLAAIDVLCISSIYEGTPLTLFEAMAAGKAVVSTAVDGCREVIEHERNGLLVPSLDAEALAAALVRVLEDAELRRSLAEGALRASRKYDVRECVRQMEALYDEVLAER